VTADATPSAANLGVLGAQLRQRLAPEGWPIPIDALPAGTALVGGAVRDALLGRLATQPDLDFVVPTGAISLCQRLARELGGAAVVLDAERDIARLVLRGWTLDLARCEGSGLASDLQRRDYTANAIALPLDADAQVLDPTGGLADLARGQLVAVSEANLLADPLRLLRGMRLSCELGLALELTSRLWIQCHASRLGEVAGERVLAELDKLAALPSGERGLLEALEAGLLTPWDAAPHPGLPLDQLGAQAAAERQLEPAETASALPLARLAALLDGPALARLHASRKLQQQCDRLRHWATALNALGGRWSSPLDGLGEAERLQLQRDLESHLPALLLSLPPQAAQQALLRWRKPDDPLFHPRPPLDGHQLQQTLGIPAGRQLGELLQHLTRERAFGRLPAAGPSNAAALDAARQWLDQRRD
jgi:tRNA nucleotidyltransferase (CCA-adding enzyme)